MDKNIRELLRHRVKHDAVGISDPKKLEDQVHATSAEACDALVQSLFGGAHLN